MMAFRPKLGLVKLDKSDHMNLLITLSMIPLSGAHSAYFYKGEEKKHLMNCR